MEGLIETQTDDPMDLLVVFSLISTALSRKHRVWRKSLLWKTPNQQRTKSLVVVL